MAQRQKSQVYLLHFHAPLTDRDGLPKSSHYLGTSRHLDQRLDLHRTGQSQSRIMRALFAKGIGFDVVMTWDGDVHLERAMKRRKRLSMLCPVCREGYLQQERARGLRRRAVALILAATRAKQLNRED